MPEGCSGRTEHQAVAKETANTRAAVFGWCHDIRVDAERLAGGGGESRWGVNGATDCEWDGLKGRREASDEILDGCTKASAQSKGRRRTVLGVDVDVAGAVAVAPAQAGTNDKAS